MKTLVYTIQNSGGSLFTYWLAQQENCISIIDLYYSEVAPFIDYENVLIKCVVNKNISIQDHIARFKPDKTILFIRNPIQVYLNLSEKSYCDFGGSPLEKLEILNKVCTDFQFDSIIKFEDFIAKKIGNTSYYSFRKSIQDIIDFNCSKNLWCQEYYQKKWSIGNIHLNQLDVFNFNLDNLHKYY
jgi:hypothetical protein